MKISLPLALFYACLISTPALANDLEVTIQKVVPGQGRLFLALYRGKEGFESEKAHSSMIVPASSESVRVVFTELPPDWYSLRCYQDLNTNDELDTNFIGIPKEPFGFSNDAEPNLGPPGWEATRFEVRQEKTLTLHLQN